MTLGLVRLAMVGLTFWLFLGVLPNITIASITIYLHRHQAHRSLESASRCPAIFSASGCGLPPAW